MGDVNKIPEERDVWSSVSRISTYVGGIALGGYVTEKATQIVDHFFPTFNRLKLYRSSVWFYSIRGFGLVALAGFGVLSARDLLTDASTVRLRKGENSFVDSRKGSEDSPSDRLAVAGAIFGALFVLAEMSARSHGTTLIRSWLKILYPPRA